MKAYYPKIIGIVLVSFLLLVGGSVNAVQIPEGGSSFEESVSIEPGNYDDFVIEGDEEIYYQLNLKAGQRVEAGFQYKCHPDASRYHYYDVIWGLYDSNRAAVNTDSFLVDCNSSDYGSTEIAWMSNSDQSEYDYSLKIRCEKPGVGVSIKGLNISVVDRYDAQSQTDAGGSVESAMEIEPGEYKGFLSGEQGSDEKDVYKVSAEAGKTLAARVVPPTDEVLNVAVLGGNRKEIRKEKSANEGAIIENEVPVYNSGDYYISVSCRDYPTCEGVTEYSLTVEEKEGISEDLKQVVPPSEGGIPEVPQDIDQITKQMQKSGEEAKSLLEKGIKSILLYVVLPVVGGIIFLIVLIVVIIIVVKKKGKGQEDQENQQMEE